MGTRSTKSYGTLAKNRTTNRKVWSFTTTSTHMSYQKHATVATSDLDCCESISALSTLNYPSHAKRRVRRPSLYLLSAFHAIPAADIHSSYALEIGQKGTQEAKV